MAPTRHRFLTTPVIPLKPDFDIAHLEHIQHRRSEESNGIREEISASVPRLSLAATPYETLHFFTAFNNARPVMSWTTGSQLFQRFPLHLSDQYLTIWTTQVNGISQSDKTTKRFDSELNDYKSQLLRGYNYDDQLDYLRTYLKPADQMPSDYLKDFKAGEAHACALPGAPSTRAGFRERERRRIFLSAMPEDFQLCFVKANLSVDHETLADMALYFNSLHCNTPSQPTPTPKPSTKAPKKITSDDSTTPTDRPRRIQSSDPCPLPGHSSHTWGECRSNAYNDHRTRARSSNSDTTAAPESHATDASAATPSTTSTSSTSEQHASHWFDNY